MNVILLTAVILTVALAHGEQGEFSNGSGLEDLRPMIQPCQQKSNPSKYTNFVHRHILNAKFNRTSLKAWERYLTNSGLCGRVPLQSFIEARESQVQQICRGAGRRVQGATGNQGNLCISNARMRVYNVKSQNNPCKVNSAALRQNKVIVACNKIGNQCFPVHYQGFNGQKPGNVRCK